LRNRPVFKGCNLLLFFFCEGIEEACLGDMGVKGCLVVDENLFPVILMLVPLVKFAKREGGGILP
jgi:hypothetical protein